MNVDFETYYNYLQTRASGSVDLSWKSALYYEFYAHLPEHVVAYVEPIWKYNIARFVHIDCSSPSLGNFLSSVGYGCMPCTKYERKMVLCSYAGVYSSHNPTGIHYGSRLSALDLCLLLCTILLIVFDVLFK